MSSLMQKGRIVKFGVDLFSCRSAHTVIHLPKECKLYSHFPLPAEGTAFKDQGDGTIVAANGLASQELLTAASIIINESIDPFDAVNGVRVVVDDDHYIIIARLVHAAQYRRICEQVAFAVYDDVSAVEVKCSPPSERFYLEHREHRYRMMRH